MYDNIPIKYQEVLFMEAMRIDFSKDCSPVKPMHAVSGDQYSTFLTMNNLSTALIELEYI